MENNIGNYAQHAQYWDWSGHEGQEEQEHWYKFAKKYGENVLIPMCAIGSTAAYMAERGLNVTAFDITPEMITEGKKRFGDVPRLLFYEADVRDFNFDIEAADFCYCVDFGHISNMVDIEKALACINRHLRFGGCMAIGTGFWNMDEKSQYYPEKTFHPFKQVYPGLKVWKSGDTRYEAETGRTYISQRFFAEHDSGKIESFDHSFYLQSYTSEAWLEAISKTGFEVKAMHKGADGAPWDDEGWCVIEAVKKGERPM